MNYYSLHFRNEETESESLTNTRPQMVSRNARIQPKSVRPPDLSFYVATATQLVINSQDSANSLG